MQQLYLTGNHAPALADRLITALNLRPAGYRLQPFTVSGSVRGEALHLLLPPAAPMDNDVPCRIRLREGDWAVVPRVLEEIAAPNLAKAVTAHMMYTMSTPSSTTPPSGKPSSPCSSAPAR